jgi:hypothetical protein
LPALAKVDYPPLSLQKITRGGETSVRPQMIPFTTLPGGFTAKLQPQLMLSTAWALSAFVPTRPSGAQYDRVVVGASGNCIILRDGDNTDG